LAISVFEVACTNAPGFDNPNRNQTREPRQLDPVLQWLSPAPVPLTYHFGNKPRFDRSYKALQWQYFAFPVLETVNELRPLTLRTTVGWADDQADGATSILPPESHLFLDS
jgi:hypothetical protein